MCNHLDFIATRQPYPNVKDIVEFLLRVDLRDEGVDCLVGDPNIVGMRDYIDVVYI